MKKETIDLIKKRHSVRNYKKKNIEEEKREILNSLVDKINKENDMNIQIIYDDEECFKSMFSKIAKFKNCSNYIALIGNKDDKDLDIKCGYFGEQIVLEATKLDLNTCWVGLTFGKSVAHIKKGEKQVIVIALGYGDNNGVEHTSKDFSEVTLSTKDLPKWYKDGVEASLLAPTAMNQQKFVFSLKDDEVYLTDKKGFYTKVDLGIVKYHFEVVTGKKVNII